MTRRSLLLALVGIQAPHRNPLWNDLTLYFVHLYAGMKTLEKELVAIERGVLSLGARSACKDLLRPDEAFRDQLKRLQKTL